MLAGEGGVGGDEVGGCALEDDPAAVVSGAGAEVDDPVGVRHDRLVVLDDDDRLAGVDQPVEQAEQLLDADRSKSVTEPMPSQRGHMPPSRVKVALSALVLPAPRSTVIAPLALTEGMLKENALEGPMCGFPSRLKRMRSIALASVTVPTVERALAPIRS